MGCAGAAGAAWWLNSSSAFAARFVRERWAEIGREILPARFKPAPSTWSENALTAAWLGHSTVLLNVFGVTILTDPVLGTRVGADLGFGVLGPKRMVRAALRPEELPPIDIVLLSHAHLDHLDLPTLRRLQNCPSAVSARNTADLLVGTPVAKTCELGWGDRTVLATAAGEVEIEAFEVRHWGARWRRDRHRGYNGYIISREGRKIIFGGDTAMCGNFADLRGRGPFDLALMPIGAYDPWISAHCTPEEAVKMANAAGAKYILPIHHQAFALGREPFEAPMERLETALERESERIVLREVGETAVLHA